MPLVREREKKVLPLLPTSLTVYIREHCKRNKLLKHKIVYQNVVCIILLLLNKMGISTSVWGLRKLRVSEIKWFTQLLS